VFRGMQALGVQCNPSTEAHSAFQLDDDSWVMTVLKTVCLAVTQAKDPRRQAGRCREDIQGFPLLGKLTCTVLLQSVYLSFSKQSYSKQSYLEYPESSMPLFL